MSNKSSCLMWFRRDLRLKDNHALFEACKNYDKVIAFFIFDKGILKNFKENPDRRVQFLWESVQELKTNLQGKGSDLILCHGHPENIIPELIKKTKASAVYCNEDYEPHARKRDAALGKIINEQDCDFQGFKDHVVFHPLEVVKGDKTAYKVFTPYKNAWLAKLGPENLKDYKPNLKNLAASVKKSESKIKKIEDIGFESIENRQKGGESEASKTLKKFLPNMSVYKDNRDFIDKKTNSSLSPYLRFGCISTRELVRKSYFEENEGAKVWLSEIIWREFYQMILFHFPQVVKEAFQAKYNDIKWPGTTAHFNKWKKGETGFPIIDAAMIHFAETGEMHNRLRMIVASFLTKDLLVDWKKGEHYFSQVLFDFDLAANNGGWQWSASTGCDAQPYFRIFNPTTQSKRFDPEACFIKEKIPALKNMPKKYIHDPSLAPKEIQEQAGCVIGKDYPAPIVDHSAQRLIAIDLFKALKN